jgi:hypothetical protein
MFLAGLSQTVLQPPLKDPADKISNQYYNTSEGYERWIY